MGPIRPVYSGQHDAAYHPIVCWILATTSADRGCIKCCMLPTKLLSSVLSQPQHLQQTQGAQQALTSDLLKGSLVCIFLKKVWFEVFTHFNKILCGYKIIKGTETIQFIVDQYQLLVHNSIDCRHVSTVLDLCFQNNSEAVKLIVVSVSVQPVLSLAASFNISPEKAFRKLSGISLITSY